MSRQGGIGLDRISRDPSPVPLHTADRTWPQTNCYLDLWIELLGRLGADARPVLGSALAARSDSSQWTFVKPDPADLSGLLGTTAGELNIWRDVESHLVENLAAKMALSIEVDSYWLPDTAGIGYRTAHGKTSVVPVEFDPVARTLDYLHNSGLHQSRGDDVEGLFSTDPSLNRVPFPYVEQIAIPDPLPVPDPGDGVAAVRRHLRAADPGAAGELTDLVAAEARTLAERGPEWFHLWSFGTLRAVGSTAEICGDIAGWLVEVAGVADAAGAVAPFLTCAEAAQTVQFRLARAARGRSADAGAGLEALARGWAEGVGALRAAVG